MDYKELQIGDWVVGKSGVPFRIGTIDPDFLHWDEINPIPITVPIIKANGFMRRGKKSRRYFCNDIDWRIELLYVFQAFDFLFEGNHIGLPPIRYIHQLQHILRDYTFVKDIDLSYMNIPKKRGRPSRTTSKAAKTDE